MNNLVFLQLLVNGSRSQQNFERKLKGLSLLLLRLRYL